ncbi:MAG: hypothetical protein K5780_04735 [Alphaproteobacteria bacterium]|nr:hypothetical protein [Alphaproteobacteria bacterium]
MAPYMPKKRKKTSMARQELFTIPKYLYFAPDQNAITAVHMSLISGKSRFFWNYRTEQYKSF